MDTPKKGETFDGRFELLDLIGSGGQSTVFKANQTDCNRRVALKILNPIAAENAETKHRFIREAKALSRLKHTGIITVYAISVAENGLPYIVMELLRGISLRQRLDKEKKLPVWRRKL